MKSYEQKSWTLPQPILIIGTYDKNRKPNATDTAWRGVCGAKEIMILFPKALNPARNMSKYNICCVFAKNYGVPLREWIETKTSFSFSK